MGDDMKADSNNKTIHVGIIEDEADYRGMLAQMLDEMDGMVCEQAFDCLESALPFFEKTTEPPEVMLVDINLPGANGIEAIKMLKALHPDMHLIVLTMEENRVTVFDAICAGATGYLLKNDSLDEIVAGIRLVLDGGSPLSGAVASMVLQVFQRFPRPTGDSDLNERETEVLKLLSDGLIKKEIADQLSIATTTVDYHLRSIYRKLQVHSLAGAVGTAMRRGLI
jgi:DNA-binding NarL/FixJ family response regulator